ncbi:glutamate ligase domain-containing protein [Novipirellula artificiosorum]|uniref:MurE-like ligase n=1 Tax=Novipirellula artificiosorum TaxID=2528016 RepID=A0A5C6DCD3_9BACT|nr:Mur ligase family protein [Novipirellula artificiosorum]TWU32886.1 MurE-like ligase [Novipirellula artificiosorum]
MRHAVQASSSSYTPSSYSAADSKTTGGSTSLRRVFPQAKFFAGEDVHFESIAEDVESAEAGQLVVYRIGQDNPTELIAAAMARGVAGILTEQILPCPVTQCIVGDVNLAMADLQSRLLDRPDRKVLTVGVYGSAGKTTTSLLVAQLLRSIGLRTAYQTDLGESDGIVQSTSSRDLPVAGELVQWLGEASDAGARTAVIELSDDAAKCGYYDSIEFDLLLITGSPVAENDFGPSGLQSVLDRVTAAGVVITSADQPHMLRMLQDQECRRFTYGVRKPADVTAKLIEQECGMSTLMVTHESVSAAMETTLCGAAMAANHAAATAVGILLNQPLEEIVEHLSGLRSVPGRMQVLSSFESADVIVDSARTPEQVAATLRAARAMKQPGGRLWCVMAIDPESDPVQLALLGGHAERFTDQPIVTCVKQSKDHFLRASHAVLDGVKKCALMRLVADQKRAIEWAISESSARDCVVILGGVDRGHAQDQRSQIERLTQWVESSRKQDKIESKVRVEGAPKILPFVSKS